MARNKSNRPEDLDFGENPTAPAIPGNTAVMQPDPVSLPSVTEDPLGMIAKSLGVKPEQLANLGEAMEKAKLIAVAGEVKEYARQMRSEAEHNLIRDQCGKSARERTQDVIEKNWKTDPGAVRYRVYQATNPDAAGKPEPFPLDIPARSPEEAQGRYLQVCGIRSTDHYVRVVPLEEVLRRQRQKKALEDVGGDGEHAGETFSNDDNGGFPSAN